MNATLKVVDLFAGCGGLSLGFCHAGYDVVAAYEKWTVAARCYRENFSHPVFEIDLSDAEKAAEHIKPYSPDVIVGGPPCQDFSAAGARTEGSRASLTFAYAHIVSIAKPAWFAMENVGRAYASHAYAEAKNLFRSAGYGLTERILDAGRCGAPQKRKRFFCIGKLGAADNFMGKLIDERLSVRLMTVREYMGDELDVEYYYRHPRNYNRRGVFSVDEPAPTVRGVNRRVPKGYIGHAGDPIKISDSLRPLTVFERARLQTFPANFIWNATKTDLEQLIGNAVPVKLAEFIARSMSDYGKNLP
ncbi:MAG: DNA cytosine methyltransferase [Rickettsiales bacterium]